MASATVAPETPLIIDPAHDLVSIQRSPLASIFTPKSVALIGATERVGFRRPHGHAEPHQQLLRRTRLARESQEPQHPGRSGV